MMLPLNMSFDSSQLANLTKTVLAPDILFSSCIIFGCGLVR